ncbi:cell filamentation protein Fic [Methyloprofundus sedimenti]|uniref:Cell filamentation protein Fic n=1 Tax=Methyloprofundus sedimenti TaxID=1420851 RepID=A0A1V8M6W2_9GAMM|nr:Fic family protein [Methyloprofundus sedimenti]OQK17272.1 cell filamentation protein Fic [Methyloprofundus sedimenti]
MAYQPPFQLTHTMTRQVARIGELIGTWKATHQNLLLPELRRGNRIKTIQASLAVEQNTLSVEQVTAVLAGKTVLGQPREIQEVLNAFAAYEAMSHWQPHNLEDLLAAHGLLMRGLVDNAGHLRQSGTGIYQGTQLVHMAPPANQLPRLMDDLLTWLKTTDAHPLIASAAFHYDSEFIHPFSDGNGRMGRLWQTLILSDWQPMLAYLPVETVIKHRQQAYYQLLGEADQNSDCSAFIEFLLAAIESSLEEAIASETETRVEMQVKTRVKTPDKILALLQQQPELTLAEVANHIGLSTSTVERAVAKLKQQHKLSYHGPKKGGYWQVKITT